jgi:hypothetical protein
VVLQVVELFSGELRCSSYLVTGDDPTPEADVSPTLALGCAAFNREVLHGRRWGNRVERHVYDGGHAPG